MEPLRLYPGSRFTVLADVQDVLAGSDLSSDTVEWAFTTEGTPEEADFTEGSWVLSTDGSRTVYNAAILVDADALDPGDVTLAPGTYRPWVRVIDNPDKPILRIDRLLVVG